MTDLDVLVVGAGPAGSLAARHAAEAGARVVLVEAAPRVGGRPHCAEYVPRHLALELDFPERCVAWSVNVMESRIPGATVDTRIPGYLLDRSLFDRGLVEAAAGAGAEVFAATRFLGFDGPACRLRGPRGEYSLTPNVVVAADGASSRVVRSLGLPRPRLLTGVQKQVMLAQPLFRTRVDFDPAWRFGYAWLFPKGPSANLGLGMAARHAGEAWAALDAFHGRLAAEGLVRPGELGRSVGAIPVSGPLASLVKGRVLFCGDAAGLTHPITGAGIPQAVLSGRAAGQAAARWALHGDEAAPAAYEADLRGRFGRMLGWAMNKRREMERAWDEEGFSRLIERSWPAFREYRSPIRPESEP